MPNDLPQGVQYSVVGICFVLVWLIYWIVKTNEKSRSEMTSALTGNTAALNAVAVAMQRSTDKIDDVGRVAEGLRDRCRERTTPVRPLH